jgi:hypothetical protein
VGAVLKNTRLRNSIALGTCFTALFLLVNCEVAERDYSALNIGGSAASGPDDFLRADAGSTDASVGGPVGPEPLPPVPCSEDAGVSSANVDAAGSADAGGADAGGADAGIQSPCACVDGFYKAVDADADGDGTRLCAIAPGLDCDDADPAVTHNSCGGCAVLPNAVGEDCLECGAYTCEGPDALACASKPGPVEDPDCRCQDALLVARDTDQDGQGTRLCEANPGLDCNDGDETFVANECGGCEPLPGAVGSPCNECGVYACSGTALACLAPGPGCLDGNTRGTCVGTGFWIDETDCTGGNNFCYQGNCEVCMPGTFQCVDLGEGSTQVQVCGSTSSASIGWTSYDSCVPGETCNPNNGACTGYLMWPRDDTFDVVPLLERNGLRWHDELNTASESDYG